MEEKTPTPSALFARSHSKDDPQSRKVFINDRLKTLWVRKNVIYFVHYLMIVSVLLYKYDFVEPKKYSILEY